MTVLALLILVVLWIVVLTPGMIGKLREKRSTESIDSFHHRLHLLERTGPKIVAPAYRLQTVQSSTGSGPGASGLPSVSSMPGRANLVLLRPVDGGDLPRDDDEVVDDRNGGHYQRVFTDRADRAEVTPSVAPSGPTPRQREARRRRRDILTGLLVTLLCTGLLGIIHSLRALWIVTAIAAVALAGFVALAAYATALATQQDQDLRARQSLETSGDPRARAVAGYPGAWDDDSDEARFDQSVHEPDYYDWDDGPRQVAAR